MVALWTEGPVQVLFRPCDLKISEVTATLVRPTWMIFDHKKHKKLEDVVKEAEAFGATLGKEYVGPQIARSNHSYSPQNSKTKNSIDMCI